MRLLICLIAVFSVVTIASPVPDAEFLDFPSSLNGITADFSVGRYLPPPPPPPQPQLPPPPPTLGILGGNLASQDDTSSVLGDGQDLSTAWGDLATTRPQSDTLSPLMYDSTNGNQFLAQAHFEDQISSLPKSDTPTPFQTYKHAECGGTKSVCCSGTGIDTSYSEQPGVPLPCSDSMQIFFFLLPRPPPSTEQQRAYSSQKENIKMIDAGYERFLWPGDSRAERYCLEPVYLSDCNTVFVSFFFLYPPLLFSHIIHLSSSSPPPLVLTSNTNTLIRPSIQPVAVSPIAKSRHNNKLGRIYL